MINHKLWSKHTILIAGLQISVSTGSMHRYSMLSPMSIQMLVVGLELNIVEGRMSMDHGWQIIMYLRLRKVPVLKFMMARGSERLATFESM
ncbi:hypothetical protein PICMEDRAFT_157126 [Pichia membranifaciens NRRL Y-2026]|uniref:Uncharacterized protein n=1 Tax=Pichia membranifaciens NRRL Y-2026 TaxID=763406 RepID=A0A1E3NFT2_9ASCO|nr:hypothetical protein PICMEDRAFT_157126 [Pichia membranifaciens NRRL Y-2026]ODQ44946.1 hypothetical protein PICMEDRAFT_157126 [Pichia membranifaciens NRRL Y-2026]